MKKILFTLTLCFYGITLVSAQNPIFVVAPKQVKYSFGINPVTTPLPITSSPTNNPVDPFDYYDGWSALHGSNGISDVVTGALKFFIIDGAIYAGDSGEYKDYAWSASQPNVLQVGNFYQPEGDGGSEQLIIPQHHRFSFQFS